MIKGCSRRMIVLKDTGSDFFEEAYFVLKSGKSLCKIKTERDFVAEAQKIISQQATTSPKASSKPRRSAMLYFFVGAAFGIAASLAPVIISKVFV